MQENHEHRTSHRREKKDEPRYACPLDSRSRGSHWSRVGYPALCSQDSHANTYTSRELRDIVYQVGHYDQSHVDASRCQSIDVYQCVYIIEKNESRTQSAFFETSLSSCSEVYELDVDACDDPDLRSATTGSAWLATLPDVAAGAAVNPSGRREELLEAGDGAITVTLSLERSPSS